jgi:hypothetical protein
MRENSTVATPLLLKPKKAHTINKKCYINKSKTLDNSQKKTNRVSFKNLYDLKTISHGIQEIIKCIFDKAMPHITKICDYIMQIFIRIQKTRGDSYAMDLIKKLRN